MISMSVTGIARELKREVLLSRIEMDVFGALILIIATAAGAFVRIYLPFTPVPITLQTFFVLIGGAVLGRRLGALSLSAYILLGAVGLPVFSGAAFGLAHLLGPTGGYLVGFIASAFAVGWMIRIKSGLLWSVLSMAVGTAVIYAFGAAWLAVSLRIGIFQSLSMGVMPFLGGDAVKLLAAATLFNSYEGRIREIYPSTRR